MTNAVLKTAEDTGPIRNRLSSLETSPVKSKKKVTGRMSQNNGIVIMSYIARFR